MITVDPLTGMPVFQPKPRTASAPSSGGGGGGIRAIRAGAGITVDSTTSGSPEVSLANGIETVVTIHASDLATASEGQLIYNTTDAVLKIYVSGAWVAIQGGGGTTASSVYGTATYGSGVYGTTSNNVYGTATYGTATYA